MIAAKIKRDLSPSGVEAKNSARSDDLCVVLQKEHVLINEELPAVRRVEHLMQFDAVTRFEEDGELENAVRRGGLAIALTVDGSRYLAY